LKHVELESLIKSFLLFFISMTTLIVVIFYNTYTKELKTLDETLFAQMHICNFELKCDAFSMDFLKAESDDFYSLHKDAKGLSSIFPIPGSQEYSLEIRFSQASYEAKIEEIQQNTFTYFMIVMLVVILFSFLFSIYALFPLRNALRLTQEFIKDILHDFNTPLSTLRLNSAMLKKDLGENEKINRMEKSIQNILDLQENLRAYLQQHKSQVEKFDLKPMVEERLMMLEKNYPEIQFIANVPSVMLMTNKSALSRILDNLLSNASKYNKAKGRVEIVYDKNKELIIISDTGKGIKNPSRIFERFYKEQDRGVGIGLHIVKKLCSELDIKIGVESKVGEGTSFFLRIGAIHYKAIKPS